MTHQEILEKAIQKAIDGGWKSIFVQPGLWQDKVWRASTVDSLLRPYQQYKMFIYNHDFAKSIWKGNVILDQGGVRVVTKEPIWKHHLMMMVIADDPIEYLKIHI